MFIMTRQAALFLSPDGSERVRVPNGYLGPVPDWVGKTKMFRQMVKDGSVAVPETTKDRDLASSADNAEKADKATRAAKKAAVKAEG